MNFLFHSRTWDANPLNERSDGIHTDTEAHNLGFQGAFVPGVTLYEHVVSELLNQGVDWLNSGRASYRFRLPVYNNERVTFSINAEDRSFQVTGSDGKGPRMFGTIGLEEKTLDDKVLVPVGKWVNPVDLITTHFDESTTIHRTGKIWHHSPLYAGETMIRKGIITNLTEHNGHQIVHFSVVQITTTGRKLVTIEHESIYRLANVN